MSFKVYEEFSHSQKYGQVNRKNALEYDGSEGRFQETTNSLDS